jgi:hypothetical protein
LHPSINQPTYRWLQGNGPVITAWGHNAYNTSENALDHCKNFVASLRDGSGDEEVISLLVLAVGAYIRGKHVHETIPDYCGKMHDGLAHLAGTLEGLGNQQVQLEMIGAGVPPLNALFIQKAVGGFPASTNGKKTAEYETDVRKVVNAAGGFVHAGSVPVIVTLGSLVKTGRGKTLLFCVPAAKHNPPQQICARVQALLFTGEWIQDNSVGVISIGWLVF